LLRANVIEAADFAAAAARQRRARGSGDAVRRKVARADGEVVGDHEVSVPRAEVGDVEREAGTQLVLQREGALPVVATVTETGKRVGAEPRFVGRQAKPCRRQRTAFAVGGGQYQVAVGNEVGVGISPR